MFGREFDIYKGEVERELEDLKTVTKELQDTEVVRSPKKTVDFMHIQSLK